MGFLAACRVVWRLGPRVGTVGVLSRDGCAVLERREGERRIREGAHVIEDRIFEKGDEVGRRAGGVLGGKQKRTGS